MKKLEALNIEPESANLQRIPLIYAQIDAESAKKLVRVIDLFEDDDDVQNVYHNIEMTEEIMEAME
ncbi:MAG: hypothetical protein CVU06_15780 [Bacteroidetes bacterium HGW-Bacteroidetes-22]|nr:MAG: hypothetical protein CVU06_15780 [Bacteroidetes bacterium HGW-Bacteroidetes-22]